MTWSLTTLNGLAERPPTRPTLGGYTLCYPGSRHVFSGPQESCKTLVAYLVAIGVRREGGVAVLIDFEMGPDETRDRLVELGATGDDLDGILYAEPEEKLAPESVGVVLDVDPALVVIDAAAGAFALEGLDDNKRSDVEAFQQTYIRPFWLAGVATITIDHVTKAADTRGAYAIGSERKVGGTDVHLGFETVTALTRGGRGLYRIKTHKDRPGWLPRPALGELQVWSDPDTHALKAVVQPPATAEEVAERGFRPTMLMERVSRHLELVRTPTSRNQIEQSVSGKAEYVRVAMDCLVREQYVVETGGERGGRMLSSLTPFREVSDADVVPPTSSPTSSHANPHNQAVPDLVPTSSPTGDEVPRPVPVVRPPSGGGEEPPNLLGETTGNGSVDSEMSFDEWRAS